MSVLAEFPLVELGLSIGVSVLGTCAFAPYVRNVLRRKTKPHAISWFLWSAVSAVCFAAQIGESASVGAIILAVGAIEATCIFVLSLFFGTRDVTKLDWLCLATAALAGLAWPMLDDPRLSVMLMISINVIGFIPTFRKSVARPHEETLTPYVVAVASGAVSLLTMTEFGVVASGWGVVVVLSNGAFVATTLLRQTHFSRSTELVDDWNSEALQTAA